MQKFGPDGEFLTMWGSNGTATGDFDEVEGIAIDSDGNICVADSGNNRIQKFSNNGQFIGMWGRNGTDVGQLFIPFGIADGECVCG